MAEQDKEVSHEHRFAHLLQPIRDLAENWNIDIAKELEDYLEELEHVTFSFDGSSPIQGKSLNFAEAALLIQGSACVYSKKVEYLYNLLFQTLELLIEKRKKNQEHANRRISECVEDQDEDSVLLTLDDQLEEAEDIDLPEDRPKSRRPSIV